MDGAANAYAINVSQKRKYRFVPSLLFFFFSDRKRISLTRERSAEETLRPYVEAAVSRRAPGRWGAIRLLGPSEKGKVCGFYCRREVRGLWFLLETVKAER